MSRNCICKNNFNDHRTTLSQFKKDLTEDNIKSYSQVKKDLTEDNIKSYSPNKKDLIIDTISPSKNETITLNGNIVVCGKLTGCNGQPLVFTDIQASNYNLTNKSIGTGISIVNFGGPSGNIRTFKSLLSTNNSILLLGGDDQIDFNGALLRMNRSVYFDTPSPNLYQIQSVYNEPSNRMDVLFSNPFTVTKNTLTPLNITSSTNSPYFQIINNNYIGTNLSPTNITENPNNNYNGNYKTEIRAQWSPYLELNDPTIETVFLIICPLGSSGGTILNAKDSFTLFNNTNQISNINSTFEVEINNSNPYGAWLYYNGINAPSTVNISSSGHLWLYLRPLSR